DGDRYLEIATEGSGGDVVRLDSFGSLFSFLKLDVLAWYVNPGVSAPDEIAWVTSSRGGYQEITSAGTVNLSGSQWTDLSWVEFGLPDPNYGASDTGVDVLLLDNLQLQRVQPVPEPPAVVVLTTALVGLVLGRSKIGCWKFQVSA